jgi:neuron navigator 2
MLNALCFSVADVREGNLKAILGLFFSLSRFKQQQKTQQTSLQNHNLPSHHSSSSSTSSSPSKSNNLNGNRSIGGRPSNFNGNLESRSAFIH